MDFLRLLAALGWGALTVGLIVTPESRAQSSSEVQQEVVPPVAVETPLDYPDGRKETHRIVLELLVNAQGGVEEARVVTGDLEFGQMAVRAAQGWRFEPATRWGTPMAARIRFEVVFEPPEEPVEPPNEARLLESPIEKKASRPAVHEEEVVVEGKRPEGERSLSRASVRQLPGAFGDAFRAIESLPGVTPVASGLPYFYVRGAPPGNVGYFLDGIRVPLLFHIAAGPSVIHPAFIDTVELHSGPYPARYGRFTGGIVAGETAPPTYEHRGEFNVRLVDAGGMIETHAFDQRLHLMAAGRYSYTAAVISLVAPDFSLSYWDYQARAQYVINSNETVTLFGFGALDQASEEQPDGSDQSLFDLIFHRFDLRYDKRLKSGGHLRVGLLGGTEVSGSDGFDLKDRLIGGRIELDEPLSDRVLFRGGIDLQTDRYTASFTDDSFESSDEPGDLGGDDFFPARVDVITGARGDVVWEVEPGVRVIPGVRFDFYVANETPLWAISSRIYAEFDVRRDWTLRHGLGVAHQLPSFVVPLPGVQPVGERGLQRSVQHSAGVEWRLSGDVTAEATVFQNIQLNMTDTLSTVRFGDGSGDVDQRVQGSGRGLELMLRRPLTRRLGGYLAYTLSRSTRSLGRERGPASFDRTHVLSGALGYQLGKGWMAGARAMFYTGIPAQTLGPGDSFSNPPRTRPFYRFDWRVEKRWHVGTRGAWWALVLEVLNTTLNKEVLSLDCGEEGCTGEKIGPVTVPSIGVEGSF